LLNSTSIAAAATITGTRRLVLAESVRHHIREEEDEMLPKARGLKIDFEALGAEILKRKKVEKGGHYC
jgi:hypothetical protein